MPLSSYDRTPDFEIEIRRPDYSQAQSYKDDLVVTFGMSGSNDMSTACIGYEFSESVSSPEGSFSLSLTLERDNQKYSWYDKIYRRDLVFIKEHSKVRFVGYVSDKRYQARMGERGPERSITVSGKSLGGLLTSFSYLLDLHILSASQTAMSAQTQFMESIAANVEKGQSFAGVIRALKDAFFSMMETVGGNQNLGVKHIIEQFVDWEAKLSTSLVAQYPVVVSAYQVGENNLWDTIQQLLNPPFHEMFGLWDPPSKKHQVWLRQTPFDGGDWISLPRTVIPDDVDPLLLVDYDIGSTDQDVKTFFLCSLPGSGISREQALTLDQYKRSMVFDYPKWPYYGFRPMYVECRFFNRSEENQKGFSGPEQLMHDLAQKMYDWYANNADFLSGSVTIMNVEEHGKDARYKAYPRIGERLGLLGGEFYIEGTRSSWQYGGQMLRSLAVSRGFSYASNGLQIQPIRQVGPRIGVLEEAVGG